MIFTSQKKPQLSFKIENGIFYELIKLTITIFLRIEQN